MLDLRAEAISRFAHELRRVHAAAGEPSSWALRTAGQRSGVDLTQTAIDEALTGKSVPSWEFVAAFVSACETITSATDLGTSAELFDLDRWRRLHEELITQLAQEPIDPRQTAADPGESSPPPGSLPQPALLQVQPEPTIARDFWTLRDRLSYAHYADAIAEFLRHKQTLPPLTIGLKAPWGAGKTSLMRMLQNNLDPQDGRQPCRLQLDTASLHRYARLGRLLAKWRRGYEVGISNLEILRQINAAEQSRRPIDTSLSAELPPPEKLRAQLAPDAPMNASAWRPTVWFNPWMYQDGEQTWAGLAHEIITQVTCRLQPMDRELFWLLLNLARVDRLAIRRQWYRLLAGRMLPFLLIWVVSVAATIAALGVGQLVAPLRDALRDASAGLLSLGTLGLVIGGGIQALAFLGKTATGPLASLVRRPDIFSASQQFLTGQVQSGFDHIVPDPGYPGRLGFLYLVQTDMKRVLDLIATPERPLVVFVDDLDRCSPSTVTQVIEAINLFLAGEFPNCVFVLGMEPSAVATHIEVAYADLVRAQRKGHLSGDCSSLGWRFLEKIVQLPLSIPAPHSDADVEDYLLSLLLLSDADQPDQASAAAHQSPGPSYATDNVLAGIAPWSSPEEIEALERAIANRRPTPETLRAAALEAQQEVLGRSAPLRRSAFAAANRVFTTLYSDRDAFITLKESVQFLPSRNPREIKRFVNLFRFYSFISERYRLLGEKAPSREQIAKLAVFAIRWPHVASVLSMHEVGHSFDQLENAARSDDDSLWDKLVHEIRPAMDLPPDTENVSAPPAWAADLRRFLREGTEIGAIAAKFV